MGKNKLIRFAENLTFPTLVQPKIIYPPADHPLRGRWSADFFHNDHPLILELGCGRGEYTIELAKRFPQRNFIGIDWKGARLWRGAKTAHEEQITNAGFLRIQIQNLTSYFAEGEVSAIWITFPVPHMEKARERKRVTSPRFLSLYRAVMADDGRIHLKTDSLPLYEYTLGILASKNITPDVHTPDVYAFPADDILSIKTTYEKLWLKSGAKICYLSFLLQ